VDEEVPEALRGGELVELDLWQVYFVEFLVLGGELKFLRFHNLALFTELVLHQILKLLPEVDLLGRCEVSLLITALGEALAAVVVVEVL